MSFSLSTRILLPMKSETKNSVNVAQAAVAATLHTLKNGLPARLIAAPAPASTVSSRPEPGYFGRIEPADPGEVTRPLYPDVAGPDTPL